MIFMTQTEPQQFTAGPHEVFLLICRNRIERQWLKSSWILEKWVPSNFEKKTIGELENFLSKHPKNLGHRLRMMIYAR